NDGSSISGWNAAAVTGTLHSIQDPSTILCASDVSKLYDSLNAMVPDIELLYPAQFGLSLVLTPHVYIMNSAAVFTDSLYLNAQGNPNAVFVIKINGALSTSTYSKVKLINGAQAKNVYWKIDGAVNINNYSVFKGTIICNNGALGAINTGVTFEGRALTTNGALSTTAMTAIVTDLPSNCASTATLVTSLSKNEMLNTIRFY